MNIQTEKLELMRLLIETESEEIINALKSVFKKKGYDFWDDLPDEVKESIGRGLKDVEENKLYDHEWVMQETKKKYGFKDSMD